MIRALGREFARRGMEGHVRRLRIYFWAIEHDLAEHGHRVDISWDRQLSLEWMRVLHVPPYQTDYAVRRVAACPSCSDPRPGSVLTRLVFPGGAKMECKACGSIWVVDIGERART